MFDGSWVGPYHRTGRGLCRHPGREIELKVRTRAALHTAAEGDQREQGPCSSTHIVRPHPVRMIASPFVRKSRRRAPCWRSRALDGQDREGRGCRRVGALAASEVDHAEHRSAAPSPTAPAPRDRSRRGERPASSRPVPRTTVTPPSTVKADARAGHPETLVERAGAVGLGAALLVFGVIDLARGQRPDPTAAPPLAILARRGRRDRQHGARLLDFRTTGWLSFAPDGVARCAVDEQGPCSRWSPSAAVWRARAVRTFSLDFSPRMPAQAAPGAVVRSDPAAVEHPLQSLCDPVRRGSRLPVRGRTVRDPPDRRSDVAVLHRRRRSCGGFPGLHVSQFRRRSRSIPGSPTSGIRRLKPPRSRRSMPRTAAQRMANHRRTRRWQAGSRSSPRTRPPTIRCRRDCDSARLPPAMCVEPDANQSARLDACQRRGPRTGTGVGGHDRILTSPLAGHDVRARSDG